MGGEIFVGIRTSDGTEHLGVTWTNWLPRFFIEPSLYHQDGLGGDALKELLEAWDRPKDPANQTSDRRLKKIPPRGVHYGAVLLDLKKLPGETRPVIWSCNSYSSYGDYLYSVGLSSERRNDELAYNMLMNRAFDEVTNFNARRPATSEEIITVAHHAKVYLDTGSRSATQGQFGYTLPMLTIKSNLMTRDANYMDFNPTTKEVMRKWLKRRKWQSPIGYVKGT